MVSQLGFNTSSIPKAEKRNSKFMKLEQNSVNSVVCI